jgi:hypothetical protein
MIPINLPSLELEQYIKDVTDCIIKDLIWFINTPDVINNVFLISIIFINDCNEKRHLKSICLDLRSSNKKMNHHFEAQPMFLKTTPIQIDISKVHPDEIINIDEFGELYDGGSWNDYFYNEECVWNLKKDEITSILQKYINEILISL